MQSAVGSDPNAFIFASEKRKPVWRDTLTYDHIRAKLEPHGLGWMHFQVMRGTHAGIGHRVGVSTEEYTLYDLRSTHATRLSAGGVADEWVTQLLRQSDAKAFKKYSQMKLQMKREAPAYLNRQAGESAPSKSFDTTADD
jgi:hypothetical protein